MSSGQIPDLTQNRSFRRCQSFCFLVYIVPEKSTLFWRHPNPFEYNVSRIDTIPHVSVSVRIVRNWHADISRVYCEWDRQTDGHQTIALSLSPYGYGQTRHHLALIRSKTVNYSTQTAELITTNRITKYCSKIMRLKYNAPWLFYACRATETTEKKK